MPKRIVQVSVVVHAVVDCANECGGSAVVDCNDECGGTAVVDCANECGGSATEDVCGECGGTETDPTQCVQEGYSLEIGEVDRYNDRNYYEQ